MPAYEVDSQHILSTSAAVRARGQAVSGEVSAMMGQLIELQGSWRGAAAAAFADVVATWQRTQQQVEASLEQIMMALGQAADSYEQAETHATRLFAG